MWIDIRDKRPVMNQNVIYYFEHTGISRGVYKIINSEIGKLHCFFSMGGGWLCDDVTHWIPDGGQEFPDPPKINDCRNCTKQVDPIMCEQCFK